MATYEKPTGDELRTLATEAKSVQARIHTAKGDIVFRFFPEDAPQHSAAFIKLARSGFYDGLTFHRVEPGFVIQGGDPSGNGTGGPGYTLDAEFNERPHLKGTVAMARSASPNSAGSQFYICLEDAPFLNRQYTVFGHVVEGQQVVDAIGEARVGGIVATHWHPDHWADYDLVRSATGAPVFVHEAETKVAPERIDGRLRDGQEIEVGGLRVRVIHTPGHTPGSICLRVGRVLISGDTLFNGGPGRTAVLLIVA